MPRIRETLFISLCAAGLLLAADAGAQEDTGTIVVKPAGKEVSLSLGGLIQAQGDFGDRGDDRFADANDRFYLRRARLNASGHFMEDFDFRLEMDLAGSLGNTTGYRAQMTDGYINWSHYAAANVRAGQLKTPFGFEQLYADPRLLTIERSLVNDRLTLSRQIGVQLGGDLLDKRLSYAVGSFNGNGTNTNANDNDKFMWAGRLAAVPVKAGTAGSPVTWSVAGNAFSTEDTALAQPSEFRFDSTPATAGNDNLFTGKRKGYGVDTQLLIGPFELWAEALQVRWEATGGRPRPTLDSKGFYVQAALYVVPKKFQVVAKYETFDPNSDASKDDTNTTTVGLNYYIKGHDLKVMLDYLRSDVATRPNKDNTDSKVIARLQVAF
jgi:phosphate-selective porin